MVHQQNNAISFLYVHPTIRQAVNHLDVEVFATIGKREWRNANHCWRGVNHGAVHIDDHYPEEDCHVEMLVI